MTSDPGICHNRSLTVRGRLSCYFIQTKLTSFLSRLGTGESNHRHWTKTGLPLSLSCSTRALEARKEQDLPPSIEVFWLEASFNDGVFGVRRGFVRKGFIILLWGDVGEHF